MDELILKHPRKPCISAEDHIRVPGPVSPLSQTQAQSAARRSELHAAIRSMRDGWAFVISDLIWLLCLIAIVSSLMFQQDSSSIVRDVAGAAMCVAMSIVPRVVRRCRKDRVLAEILADASVHNLTVLLEELPRQRGKRRRRVIAGINLILDKLIEMHHHPNRTDCIRMIKLLKQKDEALVCGVLGALQYAGAIEALPGVIRIARGNLMGKRSASVRKTAILCMESLESRLLETRNLPRILALYASPDVHPRLAKEIRDALLEILPHLVPSDRNLLHKEARLHLYSLFKSRDAELILTILNMLPNIGLLDSVAYVSSLATGKYRENGDFALITVAAADCSRMLANMLKGPAEARSLLRPNPAHGPSSAILVRPTCRVDASDMEELLRSDAAKSPAR